MLKIAFQNYVAFSGGNLNITSLIPVLLETVKTVFVVQQKLISGSNFHVSVLHYLILEQENQLSKIFIDSTICCRQLQLYRHHSFLAGTVDKMEANFCRLFVGVSMEPTYLYEKICLSTSSFIIRDMTVASRNNNSISTTAEHGNFDVDLSEVWD